MSEKIIEFPLQVNIVEAVERALPDVNGNLFSALSIVMAAFIEEELREPQKDSHERIGATWHALYEEFLVKSK